MGFNIFLNQYKKKKGAKKTMVLPVDLEQEAKRYMYDYMEGDISQVDIYNKERQACTEIRLNVNVVPVVSNVLTNYKTEIVRYEGSDSAVCLNYTALPNGKATSDSQMTTNKDIDWDDITAVRDTQLSRSGFGYNYHCGLDIFSNYHFRVSPENFKTICVLNSKSHEEETDHKNYNTLWDKMREYDGSGVMDINDYTNESIGYIHLFTAEEVLEPAEAVATYQTEQDGWYGFKNISNLRAFDEEHQCLDIHSPMAHRSANDFIDLTPERDLFDFYPKWNPYRSREEKNWNYCLTYPYSSTTEVSFIRSSTSSLVIASFDEIGNNGYTYITTVCKHGLKEGDYINLYSGDDVIIANARVFSIGSGTPDEKNLNRDYIFSIKSIDTISRNYLYKDEHVTPDDANDDRYHDYPLLLTIEGILDTYGKGAYYTLDGKQAFDSSKEGRDDQIPVPIFEGNWINPDINTLDLSMKRIENGMECSYYVRINAKLPNFKGAVDVIDEYKVQNDDQILEAYSMNSNNLFSNENGRMAFAKTIYRDNVGAVTYTENIPFDLLLNNRKQPLSDIFFTIFKNNKGWKEWYKDKVVNTEDIEYSHVFGKITCAFELSRTSELVMDRENQPRYKTIHTINNIYQFFEGEDISKINQKYRDDDDDFDEVNWEKNRFFYNDVVEYSRAESRERSIQQVQFRFNTAQRELQDSNDSFTGITFDTVMSDDYDYESFRTGVIEYNNGNPKTNTPDNPSYNLFYQCEGYYYQPHYKIPVRTVSASKTSTYSNVVPARKDTKILDNDLVRLVTRGDNYAELQTKVILHNSYYDTYFYGVVEGIENTYTCNLKLYKDYELTKQITGEELLNVVTRIQNAPNTFSYIKPNPENASYADFLEDGSFMFQWRAILPNGYDENDEEEYPFANNYLYVDKKIVFFLRRQWWDRLEKVNVDKFPAERSGMVVNTTVFDEYVKDDDINCLI